MPIQRSAQGSGTDREAVTASSSEDAHPAPDGAPRFSIGIGRTGGTVVITVHGVDGLDDWARIAAVLRDIIDAQGNLDVLLDLGDIGSLERDAAPLIVHAAQRAHSHGGRLRLADRACRERS